ncbi:hypothetical protein KFL_011070010 [Klebsormidium nitens]|uniref:Replication origin-binding protein domain-containing protein n=1 Tax=Klebsormidium nitens TaxID=105231 RepID=A0A1Y1IV43_KLENI|nr:hypothetical protein KFL_011070010 [Klebsormidium nitens]|eukprot:GAQ92716.1 hypothetical protein KFL_011070010 [Klebsormidium nitens]
MPTCATFFSCQVASSKAALSPSKPLSHELLATFLMIGGIESNPGPSFKAVGSSKSASALVPPLSQTGPRVSEKHVESGDGNSRVTEVWMEGPIVSRAFDAGSPFHEFSTNIPPTLAREERSDSNASLDASEELMNPAATVTRDGNSLQQAPPDSTSAMLLPSQRGVKRKQEEEPCFSFEHHHPLDEDFLGQLWFHKKAPAVVHQQAQEHALIGSCDLYSSGGHKKFSSFANAGVFVGYLERLRAEGIVLNHYECIDAHTSSKFYVDIDYSTRGRDEGDFQERFEHCDIVLRGFLEQVLKVPSEAIAFQVATAHGKHKNGGYKFSAHVCLQGFCLKDSSTRVELKKALALFLKNPPKQLRRSCEFLFFQDNKEGVFVEKCLIDTTVYSSFQNWRTLYSEKKGSGRPLAPTVGSSRDIADHLIGFHSPADRAAASELDGDLLAAYNQRAEPAASVSQHPARVPARGLRGTFVERAHVQHPLTNVEKDRLLRRYQRDHPGAWILRAEAMGEDVFTVHFGVNTPFCWIAGRAHSSPGNACGYLVYSRRSPSRAFYRCHSTSCSGAAVHGGSSTERLQRVLQLDAECIVSWSSEYNIVGRMLGYPVPNLCRDAEPQTTLVMANMGAGKSKELFHGLLPKLPAEASVCLIASNIALARKYHEETKKDGLDFVCYLDEAGGKITARRVVVCINSIARVLPYFDLVVMDEVNFTLTNMASTVMKDKKRVFMALEGIVASAKAAFLCDAHLNCPRVVEWIQTLRHTSRFYTIRNLGVWPSTRKAFIMPMPGPLEGKRQPKETYSLVVERVLDLVASEKSVMVPATSKMFVELLEAAFKVLMQQIQRARDAGDIQIFYGKIPSRRIIAYPSTKEEVFRMTFSGSSLPLMHLPTAPSAWLSTKGNKRKMSKSISM